jgi:hypothetical protein
MIKLQRRERHERFIRSSYKQSRSLKDLGSCTAKNIVIDCRHRISPLGELYNTKCRKITRHEVMPGTKLWDCADADTRTSISSEWTRGNM